MKSEVIMHRSVSDMQNKIFGGFISQKSKSEYFSLTDLVREGNKYREKEKIPPFNLSAFLSNKETVLFIDSLKKNFNKDPLIKGRGRGVHTWAHPLLFIDVCLAISPNLKIEVYQWLYDNLLKYRNDSGDSYKKMCGALYDNCSNKSLFHKGVSKTATMIQKYCGVSDWNIATEEQLKLRDKIHENITLLCDVLRDNNKAIELGIYNALKNK